MKLLCWLFGHKMQYAEPGDIASGGRCMRYRCGYEHNGIKWPRTPTFRPARTRHVSQNAYEKACLEFLVGCSNLGPPEDCPVCLDAFIAQIKKLSIHPIPDPFIDPDKEKQAMEISKKKGFE